MDLVSSLTSKTGLFSVNDQVMPEGFIDIEFYRSDIEKKIKDFSGLFYWHSFEVCVVDKKGNLFDTYTDSGQQHDGIEVHGLRRTIFTNNILVVEVGFSRGPEWYGRRSEAKNAQEVKQFFATQSIEKKDLDIEVICCYELVSLLYSECLSAALGVNKRHEVLKTVREIYLYDFTLFPTNQDNRLHDNCKVGDMLHFSLDRITPVHLGIFYGFDHDNCPVIFDLWDRDGSRAAKLTRLDHDDYKKNNLTIRMIPLSYFYRSFRLMHSEVVVEDAFEATV